VAARNAQAVEIQRGLRLGRRRASGKLDVSNRFEHLFWMGDLNYRVNLPRAVVVDLLAREQIEPLLVQDQLLNAVRKSEAFHGFNEAPIGFAPTFKFVPNQAAGPGAFTRPLDERKKRVPSWCDRVLSRSWPGSRGDLEQLSYEAAPEVITSDHVPVHAGFLLKISSPWETEEAIHKRFYLLLYDLHASELRPTDQNGLADPYLEVRADFMDGAVRSSIKKRTLSPNWGHEQIRIRLPPYCRSAKYLEHAHLFIRVKDYDRYFAATGSLISAYARPAERCYSVAMQVLPRRHLRVRGARLQRPLRDRGG